jgi:hypothetical protein
MRHAVEGIGILLCVMGWLLPPGAEPFWIKPLVFWTGIGFAVVGLFFEIRRDLRDRGFTTSSE